MRCCGARQQTRLILGCQAERVSGCTFAAAAAILEDSAHRTEHLRIAVRDERL
jgi:hypothetical protein